MAATNINRVVLTGNLTKDPELRNTPSGFPICELRVACNTRRKQGEEWVEKPNFFDVKVLGRQGENVANYLAKGRGVAIDGRLDWSEWQDKETGKNRQKVEIVADNVQFLGGRDDAGGGNGGGGSGQRFNTPQSDVPADSSDFAAAPAGGGAGGGGGAQDDDIPF